MTMVAETPTETMVLVWEPYAFALADESGDTCARTTGRTGYTTDAHSQANNPGIKPVCTLALFKTLISSGEFAVVHVNSHGSDKGFAVEVYEHTARGDKACDRAFERYVNKKGYMRSEIYQSSSIDGYHISLTATALSKWFKDAKSIVVLTSCHGASLNAAWGAREVLGYNNDITKVRSDADCKVFYERLIGVQGRGTGNTRREVGDACQGINAALIHAGTGNTVLAPIVIDFEPSARLLCGQAVDGHVQFDSTMDTSADPADVVTATGCDITLDQIKWSGDDVITFVARANECPDDATFTVHAASALSANNNIELDGNADPANTDGVAPNEDDFTWMVACVRDEFPEPPFKPDPGPIA
jgi:hypothetical protein